MRNRSHTRRGVLSIALAVLLTAAAAHAADHAVILQYHHFGTDTPPSTSVTPEVFEEHLDWLDEHDFHVWSLIQVVDHLRRGRALPDSCVVLTMDDGYESVYSVAWPMVRERGWPMTVFLPTRLVGGGGYLDWEQVREMAADRVHFASHSHGHDYLVRRRAQEDETAWLARVRADIEISLERLRGELGDEGGLFAWPYGEFVPEVEEIILDLDLIGLGQHSGPAWTGSDFGALPRYPMAAGFAEMEQFTVKVASLPLPVRVVSPESPLLPSGEDRPLLHLEPVDGAEVDGLVAYASGQGHADLQPAVDGAPGVTVQAFSPLPFGRSRYNITAPGQEGRWRWFSQPWIRFHETETSRR